MLPRIVENDSKSIAIGVRMPILESPKNTQPESEFFQTIKHLSQGFNVTAEFGHSVEDMLKKD
jgi:hypothetical protein